MSKFKVGDRVEGISESMSGEKATVIDTKKKSIKVHWDGDIVVGWRFWPDSDFRLIKAEPKSPIRTVTRKEIVPGTYGIVCITDEKALCVETFEYTADQLREAAHTLNQIAEALEDD